MALFAETEDKIFGEILNDIVNETNLRRVSPGSKTRAIAQALAKKLGQMYRKFDVNIALAFLDGAEGRYLDFIGDMLGTPRLGEQSAKVTAAESNLKFYVDTGTFGDINGGQPILITSGTAISTSSSGGISYVVPYNMILSASEDEAFVAGQSSRPGTLQNVGVNQLIFHNFINYSDIANETLKVTNDAEIVTGQAVESETNYRFRIANKVVSSEGANLTAIRIAALSVPGVADLPFHRGIGTYDLLIKSTTPKASSGLIAAVQEATDQVTAQGIVGTVRKPKETGLSLVASLTFRRALSSGDQQTIIQNVTTNISDYVNGLDIGEEFIVQEALERARGASDEIKNVGTTARPFDTIYIYRETKLDPDQKVRSILLGDFAPEADERIIVEQQFAGATPILVRVAQ